MNLVDDDMTKSFAAGRAYSQIKNRLFAFRVRPTVPLHAAEIADMIGVSITPVREALIRLSSEALIETGPRRGFTPKILSHSELEELYTINEVLLKLAAESLTFSARQKACLTGLIAHLERCRPPVPEAIVSYTEMLFHGIAAGFNAGPFNATIGNISDQLHCIRKVEATALPDITGELLTLARTIHDGTPDDLRACLSSYHTRRIDHIPALLKELYNRLHTG